MRNSKDLEYEQMIDELERDDVQSEKKKKQLKRKVIKRNIVILILLIIIILLLLKSCGADEYLVNLIPNFETSEYIDQTQPTGKIPHIDIPVVVDTIVSAQQPYIHFSNPESNKDRYYLQYEIYRQKLQNIYQSELVQAGTKFSVNLYELFDGVPGDYSCNVKVRTFKVGTLIEVNGINNDIKVTVRQEPDKGSFFMS